MEHHENLWPFVGAVTILKVEVVNNCPTVEEYCTNPPASLTETRSSIIVCDNAVNLDDSGGA